MNVYAQKCGSKQIRNLAPFSTSLPNSAEECQKFKISLPHFEIEIVSLNRFDFLSGSMSWPCSVVIFLDTDSLHAYCGYSFGHLFFSTCHHLNIVYDFNHFVSFIQKGHNWPSYLFTPRHKWQ